LTYSDMLHFIDC